MTTLLVAAPVLAEPVDPRTLAEAQAIFDDAQRLMAAHQLSEACPKFEEVVRMVPSGVGARMRLAKCYEEAGRLASAWAAYLIAEDAASSAGQMDRAKTAREQAGALKPRLSTLTITVPECVLGVVGLEIRRNGAVVPRAEWGIAVPVDGGAFLVTVTAPSKIPWSDELQVGPEGSARVLALPAQLARASEAPAPARPAAPVARAPDAPLPPRSAVPAWAWAIGGVGVALAGVSVGFLVDERATQANIDAACPDGRTCTKGFAAHGANVRLYRDFDVFVCSGVAGIVGLGASVAGIATAPKRAGGAARAMPRPWAAPGAVGLGWSGHFE